MSANLASALSGIGGPFSASGLHFPENSAGPRYVPRYFAAAFRSGGAVGSAELAAEGPLEAGAT